MNNRITNDPTSDGVDRRSAGKLERQDDWHFNRLSSVHEMAVFIDAVLMVMVDLRYPPKDLLGTRLALEEAICNAIKHGHQHDPTKVVEIRYRIGADHFLVEVADQGPGFDPSQIPDATTTENREHPCGRGLLLMRHYAAWVHHNPEGNCVTFCIRRSAPLPAQQPPENIPVISWKRGSRTPGSI